jgi:hypothetical protein
MCMHGWAVKLHHAHVAHVCVRKPSCAMHQASARYLAGSSFACWLCPGTLQHASRHVHTPPVSTLLCRNMSTCSLLQRDGGGRSVHILVRRLRQQPPHPLHAPPGRRRAQAARAARVLLLPSGLGGGRPRARQPAGLQQGAQVGAGLVFLFDTRGMLGAYLFHHRTKERRSNGTAWALGRWRQRLEITTTIQSRGRQPALWLFLLFGSRQ